MYTKRPPPAAPEEICHALPLPPHVDRWLLLCFVIAFLYSAALCQIAAACPFSGLSRLGSPSRLWIESRIVRTLYTADHFSCAQGAQSVSGGPPWPARGRGGSVRGAVAHLQDVQADVAVLVHVRVEARRVECHLRRLVRIARWELESELVRVALIDLGVAGARRGERGRARRGARKAGRGRAGARARKGRRAGAGAPCPRHP